jgi:hypothetical protein
MHASFSQQDLIDPCKNGCSVMIKANPLTGAALTIEHIICMLETQVRHNRSSQQ